MKTYQFGLDISDKKIELVSLGLKRGSVRPLHYGSVQIPPGLVVRGEIRNHGAVVDHLKELTDKVFGPGKKTMIAGVSFPEAQVYSKVFSVPASLDLKMAVKAVRTLASQIFPFETANLIDDIASLSSDGEKQLVVYAAAKAKIVSAYKDVLDAAGIIPEFAEGESEAFARSLAMRDKELSLVVDIGEKKTLFVVCDENGVQFDSSIAAAGAMLTTEIQNRLQVSEEEAEKMKRTYGLDPTDEGGRVMFILQKGLTSIIDEMRKTIEYFEKERSGRISRISLSGGTSRMPMFIDYVRSNFPELSVELGDPLRDFDKEALSADPEFTNKALSFAGAIGLALRLLSVRPYPQLDLFRGQVRKRQGLFSQLLGPHIKESSMATRAKKTTPKKGRKKSTTRKSTAKKPTSKKPVNKAEDESVLHDMAESTMPESPPQEGPDMSPEEEMMPESPPQEGPDMSPEEEMMPESADIAPAPVEEDEGDHSVLAQISPAIAAASEDLSVEDLLSQNESADSAGENHYDIEDKDGDGEEDELDETDIYHDRREKLRSFKKEGADRQKRGKKVVTFLLIVILLVAAVAAVAGLFKLYKSGALKNFPIAFDSLKQTDEVPSSVMEEAEPAPSTVGTVFVLSLKDMETAGDRPLLITRVAETDVALSDRYDATGEGVSEEAKSKGTIKVINETSRGYTFVATTRFLSEEGVLFRLDEASPIAADGETPVSVTADKAGPDSDIGPSRFTIPGLSAALQQDIYGMSDSSMTGGEGTVTVVSVDDIAGAKTDLEARLMEEAAGNFTVMVTGGETVNSGLVSAEELEFTAPEAGEAQGTFEAGMTMRFRAMLIPGEKVLDLLTEGIPEALPEDANADDYDLGTVTYSVEAYDTDQEIAVVRAEAPLLKR